MNHNKFSYYIGQALQGIFRNGVMSVASVVVLMSCLVVLSCFGLLVVNINVNLENLGLMNEIVVFLDYDLTEEQIVAIEDQIEKIDNIGEVDRITADEGLTQMKDKAGEFGYLYEDYRDDNPLSDCFKITHVDSEKITSVTYSLRQIEGVRETKDQIDLANMITSFKNGVTAIFVWFLAVIFIITVFVIINTVKLSVYSRKNEISIMRYLGATGWFISFPFVLEGMFIGVIAALPAVLLEYVIYNYTVKAMDGILEMITFIPVSEVMPPLVVGSLVVGVLTGVIGSTISLSKYTRK